MALFKLARILSLSMWTLDSVLIKELRIEMSVTLCLLIS
jgi:hypothetical protein